MVADEDAAAFFGNWAGGEDFQVVKVGGENAAEIFPATNDRAPFQSFGGSAAGIHGAGK